MFESKVRIDREEEYKAGECCFGEFYLQKVDGVIRDYLLLCQDEVDDNVLFVAFRPGLLPDIYWRDKKLVGFIHIPHSRIKGLIDLKVI